MGQHFCSQNRTVGIAYDVVADALPGGPDPGFLLMDSPSCNSSDQHALEVAQMIAADRQTRSHDSTSQIPVLFEVRDPGMQDSPGTFVAVHRTTGMVRRLLSVRKPVGLERQEQLRSIVSRLQRLRCDGVSRVLEVFEDCRTMSLVMEHCSGGTVYDRILQRQYFAEQESAVLIRHVLQSLLPLHRCGLAHGHPTPDSFRFHGDAAHAALKLVDFGLDLKVHEWDALDSSARAPGCGRAACPHFFETCRLVFHAPEIAQLLRRLDHQQPVEQKIRSGTGFGNDLDADLLAEVIDGHLELEEEVGQRSFEAADTWSVGAIAFLLLCGYPPFFAPCRDAILNRVGKAEYSFDPPFWSKISEEAKDFVQRCLTGVASERLTATEALGHPWIQLLAETSPSGSMLSSFALNLRRFYRTSLIEVFAANSLAAKLSHGELRDLHLRCHEVDINGSGFFTATDLRQVLAGLGHTEIADAIAMCFPRTLRHPGESYIDYVALLESIRVRRELLLEEELWRCFGELTGDGCSVDPSAIASGRLPMARLGDFLRMPDVREALHREGADDPAALADEVQRTARPGQQLPVDGAPRGPAVGLEVAFLDVTSELLQLLPPWPPSTPDRQEQAVSGDVAAASEA